MEKKEKREKWGMTGRENRPAPTKGEGGMQRGDGGMQRGGRDEVRGKKGKEARMKEIREMAALVTTMWMVAAVLAAMLLTGCASTKYVEVERVRTDTTYITRELRDSIYLRDSIHVTERQSGDTIFLTSIKLRTKYIERVRTDTTYVAHHDTVPYPVEIVKEVARDYSWWDRTRFYLLYGIVLVLLFRYWKKIKSFFH